MKHTHNITDMNCVYRSNCIAKQCSERTQHHTASHRTTPGPITQHTNTHWTWIYFCAIFSLLFVIFFFNPNLFLECLRFRSYTHTQTNIDYSIKLFPRCDENGFYGYFIVETKVRYCPSQHQNNIVINRNRLQDGRAARLICVSRVRSIACAMAIAIR